MTAAAQVELARGGAPEPPAAARMMARLRPDLARLVGPAAFDVMLARSLVLARRDHPALARVAAGPAGAITGLDGAGDVAALQEGGLAIVAHFIELLATLIGEDLAMRIVGKAWPGAEEQEER